MGEPAPHLTSIQGGRSTDREPIPLASAGDVDAYVGHASDGVLECRARGRHSFPPPRLSARMVFDDITDDGMLVRHTRCAVCHLARLREVWTTAGRGRNQRLVYVGGRVGYWADPDTGERYPAPPGRGRITPRQVKESVATAAMKGASIAKIKGALRAAKKGDE